MMRIELADLSTRFFSVTRPSPDKGLSAGEKAGIGIGAASLVIGILGIIGWRKSRFRKTKDETV
jgi:hypothetical protein